jgi:hypothetical protein
VTAMIFHGPTRIKDAVAIAAHKSHCLCSICRNWTPEGPDQRTYLHAVHPGKMWAGGQGLAQALRELLQNSRCKQYQQTTEVAVHLTREFNCMDVEVSWPCGVSHCVCINVGCYMSVFASTCKTIEFWGSS